MSREALTREGDLAWRVVERAAPVVLAVGTYYLWRLTGWSEPAAIVGAIVLWSTP